MAAFQNTVYTALYVICDVYENVELADSICDKWCYNNSVLFHKPGGLLSGVTSWAFVCKGWILKQQENKQEAGADPQTPIFRSQVLPAKLRCKHKGFLSAQFREFKVAQMAVLAWGLLLPEHCDKRRNTDHADIILGHTCRNFSEFPVTFQIKTLLKRFLFWNRNCVSWRLHYISLQYHHSALYGNDFIL